MEEQNFSFRDSIRIVARRPRHVLIVAVIGLLLGAGYAVSAPALATSKALVLLPPSANSASGLPTQDTATEVAIAQSARVLVPAAAAIGLRLPYATLQKRVSITNVTPDIIQIQAAASSGPVAVKLANSVAEEFVAYSSNQASVYATGQEGLWNAQATGLQNEISDLNKQIANTQAQMTTLASNSPAYRSDATLLDTLNDSLSNNTLQLRVVESEINQAELSTGTPGSNIIVLQGAKQAQSPSGLRIPKTAGIGLGIGLLIGMIVAFARGRSDRRVRQRDDIARAAGVPVLASVSAAAVNRSANLLEILEHFDPSIADKASLRRLLDDLEVPKRGSRTDSAPMHNGSGRVADGVDVQVITVSNDHKAVVATTEIAAFAAKVGLPVALVVGTSTDSTQQLAIACAARDPLDLGAVRPNLITYATAPDAAPQGVSLTVTLEMVDPRTLDVSDTTQRPAQTERRSYTVLVVSP
ncbi:MAG: hypothetical protein WAM97_03190, partial [Acidimicrobiales bacterium]